MPHSDLALALCLELQRDIRKDLRLVVMSATLGGGLAERVAELMGRPQAQLSASSEAMETSRQIVLPLPSASKELGDESSSLRIGQVVSGVVQSMRAYGTFIELENGIVGLLHISQISSERIKKIEDLFNVGDRLKVMLLLMIFYTLITIFNQCIQICRH